ncbi:hypothetical protein [Aquirhabdus sp.]|uniref:hypothetical protein n=1 Tax=Aquirhabdus sp. TaxID=2824160 RepID=UPI00396D0030
MLKLLIIAGVILYLVRVIWRMMSPVLPPEREALELKACAFCNTLIRVDKGVSLREHFFCSRDHANRFFQ